MTGTLSGRFQKAQEYAFQLHREQLRKGSGVPYYAHLMGVCALVLEYGGNEAQAIAALLHDAVEDQGGKETLAKIRTDFGSQVAGIVKACSDSDTTPKPPWLERKTAYLRHLGRIRKDARLVSLADKYYNATTIWWDLQKPDVNIWERFNAEPMDILWYYCMLVEKFRGFHHTAAEDVLVEEFDRVVTRLVRGAGQGLTCRELRQRHGERLAPAEAGLYTVRQAVAADIAEITTLDEVAAREEQRRAYIQKIVSAGECWLSVGEDGRIAGYGALDYSFFDQGFIHILYIRRDKRRTGAGRCLLRHLESLCATPRIFTSTNLSNQAMQNLLALMKYQRSGMVQNLDDGDPELIYVKFLSQVKARQVSQ